MLRTAQSLPPDGAFDAGLRRRAFPPDAASLLPGLLAATRTGLSPAGDDELAMDQVISKHHLHLWAHEGSGLKRFRMKNPSPGSCFGGVGRPGEGTVPIGAALTTTMRRASVDFIASTIARVPRDVIPASDNDRGPSPESTASAPATADFSAPKSG